jgi:CubicO group peptidase (beta-lactamase class C family)
MSFNIDPNGARVTAHRLAACCAVLILAHSARALAADPADRLSGEICDLIQKTLSDAVNAGRSSATVGIFVKDGSVRCSQGFGWDDPEQHHPVSPQTSRFQVASISKTFTALALAQLREAGAISFNDAANGYLKGIQLPSWDGQQITVRELATHTAGFDESQYGSQTRHPVGSRASAAELSDRLPRLFRPPGGLTDYSNVGVDVLGQIVRSLSNLSFEDYVRQRIYEPLGMTHSAFVNTEDEHLVVPFDPAHPASATRLFGVSTSLPSAGVISTASDMGRYMVALLDARPDNPVISPAIRSDLFTVLHESHPYGNAHGLLYDIWRFGARLIVSHSGSLAGNECWMALSPQDAAGLFYCFTTFQPENAKGPQPLTVEELAMPLLTPLLMGGADVPASDETPRVGETPPVWKADWNKFTGRYEYLRRSHFGAGRLQNFLHPFELRFARGAHGLTEKGLGELREVHPGVFQGAQMADYLAFFEDPYTGREVVSRGVYSNVWQQPAAYDDPGWVRPIAFGVFAICCSGLLFPFWRASSEGRLRNVAALSTAVIPIGITVLVAASDLYDVPFELGNDPALLVTMGLAFAMIAVAALLTTGLPRDLQRTANRGLRFARWHHGSLTVSAWLMVALLVDAGLIGFRIN